MLPIPLRKEDERFLCLFIKRIQHLRDCGICPEQVQFLIAPGVGVGAPLSVPVGFGNGEFPVAASPSAPPSPAGLDDTVVQSPKFVEDVLTAVPHGDDLTDKDEAILAVLRATEKPLKGIVIAGRGKMEYEPYFRRRLRRLVDLGLIAKSPEGGYFLTK